MALLLGGLVLSGVARGEATDWSVTPLVARGVDPQTAAIFRDLLENALGAHTGGGFRASLAACADVTCAQQVGARLGVGSVVFGALSQLGEKLIVTVTVVDVASGTVRSSQKIAVDRVEDLDAAAERIALAIVSGTGTDETARLGTITAAEVAPDRRREGLGGLGLRVGGLMPLHSNDPADLPGVLIDASYWYETPRFAIEPRVGLRFDANGQEDGFVEVPMDLGAYWILGQGDVAPFIGGGAGLRYLSDRRYRTFTTGEVIVSTHTALSRESAFGLGTFGRVGVLLLRTYSLRVAVTADYNVTFVKINGVQWPTSATLGVGAYF